MQIKKNLEEAENELAIFFPKEKKMSLSVSTVAVTPE